MIQTYYYYNYLDYYYYYFFYYLVSSVFLGPIKLVIFVLFFNLLKRGEIEKFDPVVRLLE